MTSHFNSSFTPPYFGYVPQACSLPRPYSFAGASQQHICADLLILCPGRQRSRRDEVTAWCSVSTQIPWFGSLPPSRVQLGQTIFFIFFKPLFDTFWQASPNPPLFMPHLHVTCVHNAHSGPQHLDIKVIFLCSLPFCPTLFASCYDPSPLI